MPAPCVATIGTFDGVHRGHRFVLQQVISQAQQRGFTTAVVTFRNHPLQVLRPDFRPQFLTTAEEKLPLLKAAGIGHIELINFTPSIAQMTAADFMRQVLSQQLGVQALVIGYDNHFGHDHLSFPDYVTIGQQVGIDVIAAPQMPGGLSSTAIRKALLTGDVETANSLLGYPYTLSGTVVHGFRNGHTLGYPTANLQLPPTKLIPKNGVYLVRADQGYGMLNIGIRPTLHNGQQRTIEVHLFDFDGDLYGQPFRIQLLHHLRGEREFRTLAELKVQLERDKAECKKLISKHD